MNIEVDYIRTDCIELKYNDEIAIYIENTNDKYIIECESNNKRTRAIELLDYIVEDTGIVKGNEKNANSKVEKLLLNYQIDRLECGSVEGYISEKLKDYYQRVDVVDTSIMNIDISKMSCYIKKQIPWAFVKTTDVALEGTKILVKSLENTTGTIIEASEDRFIMIGVKGEVYDITREKFEKSYDVSKEKLDIFERMMDFIPTVELLNNSECVSIDEIAHICYPKKSKAIYARKLAVRTKVFGSGNGDDYFLGHQGDYLAVKVDDIKDAYVIKNSIFNDTYELCEE